MGDYSAQLQEAVRRAYKAREPLYLNAGGSKRHLSGRDCMAPELDISRHSGIVDYQPDELVLSARAGTPLQEIVTTLQEKNQCLPFEPPLFNGKSTLGGTVACNMSGPARPWAGSARDLVLGVNLINGKGEALSFGGQVIKNVAGYDVSRLQAGALGTLGLMTELSIKVLPLPEASTTLAFELDAKAALAAMQAYARQPKPLQGSLWVDGILYLRLCGSVAAVKHTAKQWGGDDLSDSDALWRRVCEMTHPFFNGPTPLWRFSMRPTAAVDEHCGDWLIDWGGAQRWLRGEQDQTLLQKIASDAGGHVTLFSGGDRSTEVRHPLNSVEQTLQQRLKESFDPAGILNPGRLYSWM